MKVRVAERGKNRVHLYVFLIVCLDYTCKNIPARFSVHFIGKTTDRHLCVFYFSPAELLHSHLSRELRPRIGFSTLLNRLLDHRIFSDRHDDPTLKKDRSRF